MTRAGIWMRWAAGAAILGILALYFVFDPGKSGFAPKCVLHEITGFDCPGCGSQRMIHALLHGDFAAAWGYNAFLLCMIPVFGVMFFASCTRRKFPRLYAVVNSLPVIILISASIVIWTLCRNFM